MKLNFIKSNLQLLEMSDRLAGRMEFLSDHFNSFSYPQKLEHFHACFNLIPFPFPKMDPGFSWFYHKGAGQELYGILNKEVQSRDLYERSFTCRGNNRVFDIKPRSQTQRIRYNSFLISLFLSGDYVKSFTAEDGCTGTKEDNLFLLKAKCRQLGVSLAEINTYLQERNSRPDPKLQFARVFHTGFSNKKINLHRRHKFVELYLYCQGIATAAYMNRLQNLIRQTGMSMSDLPDNVFADSK